MTRWTIQDDRAAGACPTPAWVPSADAAVNRASPTAAPATSARQFALEQVIELLAQPYAGRDGWRKDWAA